MRSAASAADFPRDDLGEVALVGRSNVGKSSLINALLRQRLARTSGAPGKTRLVNIYRVAHGDGPSLYLVDLPGYGYARGGHDAAAQFEALTREYFGRERAAAILLVDSRHPGLDADRAAWAWMHPAATELAIVATKIDKLSRAERTRALTQLETAFENSVLPFSAVTGEGLDELWKLIDRLASSPKPPPRSSNPGRTAAPPPRPLRRLKRAPRPPTR